MNFNEQLQQAYNQGYTRGIEENKSYLYEQSGTGGMESNQQGPLTLPTDGEYYGGSTTVQAQSQWQWGTFSSMSSNNANWNTGNFPSNMFLMFDYNGDGTIGTTDWYILCMMAWNAVPYMGAWEFTQSEYYDQIMDLVAQIPDPNQQQSELPATQENSWKRQAGIKYGYIKPMSPNMPGSPPSP